MSEQGSGVTLILSLIPANAPVNPSLLTRIADGDPDAVQSCMDSYGALVWSLARRSLGNHADAEDVVQEIFADLWVHAGRFDPNVASEKTFIAMIARRRIIDRQRQKKRRLQVEPLTEAAAAPAADERADVDTRDAASAVAGLLDHLDPQQKAAIELSVYHGLSHQSISERLSVPLGTIKSHIRRGLMEVRELISRSESAALRRAEP